MERGQSLSEAIYRNDLAAVRLLLEDQSLDVAYNALIEAIQAGRTEIVNFLLVDGRADPSAHQNYPITRAVDRGHIDIVKLLLKDERVNPSAADNNPIMYAIYRGHTEIVELLLEDERVDPRARDNRSIDIAVRGGHTEIVDLLLNNKNKRADPTARDNEAIRMASRRGHTEIVKLLLEDERVDPTAMDNYPIRFAVREGHTEIVDLLLNDKRADKRVDPSTRDNYPIKHAADSNQPEIMKLLICLDPPRGVNINYETVVNFLFANPYLLEHISDPIFMETNWQIYINTQERTRLLLKHRYLLFKAWWETGNNLQLLTADIREIITQYAQDMEGTLNSIPIPPEVNKEMQRYLVTYRK